MNKEVRIYLISEEQYNKWLVNHNFNNINYNEEYIYKISDEEFIEMAEECGFVYSLNGFETQWNKSFDVVPSADNSYMRII